MKSTAIVTTIVALVALSGGALAAESRLNQLDFSRANACLAYAGLPALQSDPLDVADLQVRYDATKARIDFDAKSEAANETREIRAMGRNATSSADVARLKLRRDRACALILPQAVAPAN